MIFRIGFVQISEIYTHPPFFIPFWHQYHIGQPFQELNPLDMTNFQQLLHFFLDDLILLSPEVSALLYNRFGIWFDIELVYGHLWINTYHVLWSPREQLYIISQYFYYHFLDFKLQLPSNFDLVAFSLQEQLNAH